MSFAATFATGADRQVGVGDPPIKTGRETQVVSSHADIATLVIDCADPEPMYAMYTALGAVPDDRYPAHSALQLSGLTLSFQQITDHVAPTWPGGSTPAQLHLDFFVDDPDEMERHLHRYGARTADHQPHREHGLIVMLDPAGHPFCIGTRL